MTNEEKKFIEDKMKEANIKKFQHFALTMLIQGEVLYTDFSELRQLNYEVKKIGSNINQVVRLENQFEEISTIDIKNLTEELQHLTALVGNELQRQQSINNRIEGH